MKDAKPSHRPGGDAQSRPRAQRSGRAQHGGAPPAHADAWEGKRAVSDAARLGLAKVASKRRDSSRALRLLRDIDATTRPLGGLALKALLLRRRGEIAAAAQALEEAPHVTDAPARVRLTLAKLYEHHLKDFGAARAHAQGAQGAEPGMPHARRLQRLATREAKSQFAY